VSRALITGGAGFIGSHLADRLLSDGHEVVVYDNFSTGRREFVEQLGDQSGASVVEGDMLDETRLRRSLAGCETVFHLQANADVRHGLEHPRRDLEQNTVTTSILLEAMRDEGVDRIALASTGSIYGEPATFPTPEDAPFPTQTSLYGASKLAAEGMIGAYCHGYGFTGVTLRFVSVLGERYTHGHVYDFYRALQHDPERLRILGDGRQRKSYLHVGDCVSGIITALDQTRSGEFEVFNLGTDETIAVDESVALITAHMGLAPELEHTGGERGWPGDSPLIHLDCTKLRSAGWEPELTIPEAIERTLSWLDVSPWIFEALPR
jgi:UDP-glucose 4-epimerase